MGAAADRGWPLPVQATSPPDVVSWLTQGLDAAAEDVTEVNDRILYGPLASLPASLPVGVVYMGY